ncbi:hypothetical protein QBC39DRAFT_363346 [Podospora conica]|nr:hypothetical protein QBC39DRAFT_363346 [Schizothecium conicum]
MPGRLDDRPAKKRPRADTVQADGEEDDDDFDVDDANPSPRNDNKNRKRARISDVRHQNGDSANQEDDSDPEDDSQDPSHRNRANRAGPSSPPKTQFDQLRDGNFEHLAHELADDARATQRLTKKAEDRPVDELGQLHAIAENGILESVTCVNFMCHERLHVALGPRMNFVVGENGSGKSAILTAITLCLGGKASSTNRGGSLKSFVKEGCDRAILTVKVKNQGQNAYEQDLYGDSIIIERHFGKTSGSGFKLKSETGSIVSTKRDDVDRIVEFYALQVDNPLTVLSQDNARQFLNASTKAQKYKFFVDGVQLQQLNNDYQTIQESLDQMQAKVPDQEERVKHTYEVLQDLKRKKEALKGNERLRQQKAVLRNHLGYFQVAEEEKELREREQILAAADPKIEEAERAYEAASEKYSQTQERISRLQLALAEAEEELKEAQAHAEEESAISKKMRVDLQQTQTEERDANSNFQAAKRSLRDHKQKIEAEETRLEQANGEAHSRKTRELEDAKKTVEDIAKALEEAKNSEDLPNVDAAKKRAAGASAEIQRKRDELHAVEEEIQHLERSQPGPFDGYEGTIRQLMTAIERERRFRSKPIGPLGKYIQLLKPQWSDVLETLFGKDLNGFLVTNKEDMRLLQTLMHDNNVRNSPVLLSTSRGLNLQGKEPDDSFDTVLRVLKFENNQVRDQLVISHGIEQVVLIPDRKKAQEVMFSGGKPRNVNSVICFRGGAGSQGSQGLRLMASANGISTAPVAGNRNMRPRMKGDSGSRVAMKKDMHRRIEEDYRAVEREHRLLQQEVQRCTSEIDKRKASIKALENRLRHAQVKVDNIEAELDQFDGADGRLQGLKEQLPELEASVDHMGRQLADLHKTKELMSKALEEAVAKSRAAKVEARDAQAKVEKTAEKLKGLSGSSRIELVEKNQAEMHIAECQRNKERAQGKVERQRLHVEEILQQAMEQLGNRLEIPDGETQKSLEKQYDAVEARIKAASARAGMTEEELNPRLEQATQEYNEAASTLKSIKKVNDYFKKTLELRLDRWRKFQRLISAQSRCNFVYLLTQRGFRGKLIIDHRRKLLDLQIEPDSTNKKAGERSTKTLSGGEKSFSSICLLLSIWEAMSSPLRCLDEFDVFMDNVNRAISTNMLVDSARQSVNRQYIFITPNAIEGRELGKDVKVIRLTDPRQRLLADH